MNRSLRPVSDRNAGEVLFLNEELGDVSVIVKDNRTEWRFPGHSLILSTQSPVLRRMLSSDLAESRSRQIVIEDISPSTVKRFLKYIYCGTVDLEDWNEGIELLKAAHKYDVDHLVQKCALLIQSFITLQNVCYIFNEAILYSLSMLKEKCLRLILDAGFVVLRSRAFEMLSKEAVLKIISHSQLNVDKEMTVLDALRTWASLQCCRSGKHLSDENILLELQPLLQYIHFGNISATDKSALPTSILSSISEKPNSHSRIRFTMLESLLSYGNCVNFEVMNSDKYKRTNEILSYLRFATNSPIYLLSFSIIVMASYKAYAFSVGLSDDNAEDSSKLFYKQIHKDEYRNVGNLPNGRLLRADIVLQPPVHLVAKTVYKIFCGVQWSGGGHDPESFFLQTQMMNGNISENVGFSIHGTETYGITRLVFLNAMDK